MLVTIIAFLFILSVLVIVHETGHFLTAKYFGVKVEEFGLGFPPRAHTLHTSRDGVMWTLNWLPLGGFVKLKGEDGSMREDPDSFGHKAPWKRVVILAAGVVMNFILAFVLLAIGYTVGWPEELTNITPGDNATVRDLHIMLVHVEEGTPADAAGLIRGDLIRAVDGVAITDLEKMQSIISESREREISLHIERGNQEFVKQIIPKEITFQVDDADGKKETVKKFGIGVALGKFGVVSYPLYLAVPLGAKNTALLTGKIIGAFYSLIKDIVTTRKVSPNIGGPVMIAAISGRAVKLGFIYIIQFLALLSLNLAIINILPIPALDGGRILFVAIEKFKGRAVSLNVETWVHMIGFWLLIGLTILITARDINRFQLWEKVKDIITS